MGSHATLPLLLSLVAALAAAPALATSRRQLASSSPLPWCYKLGGAAGPTWMNASRTCKQLWSRGAPVRVPDDTATLKWGQLSMAWGAQYPTFTDRNGTQYPLSESANPPANDMTEFMLIWPLLLVRAHLRNGKVTSFTVELYIPYETIMSTMTDTSIEGTLTNFDPIPVGPANSSWFKWTFGKSITVTGGPTAKYGTFLHGTFVNLFRAARDKNGMCQPALCEDPTKASDACKYYTDYFGNSTNMTLSYDTSMHGPGDVELVPMFPATNRQYMTRFISLYTLLDPEYKFVPVNYTFIGHGTPMGTPFYFTGILKKGGTSISYC